MRILIQALIAILLLLVKTHANDDINDDLIEETSDDRHFSNTWAVHIEGGLRFARDLTERHGFIFHGQLGTLDDIYHIEHSAVAKRSRRSAEHHKELSEHPNVRWVDQQKILKRKKRGAFSDPLWPYQWYLKNDGQTKERCKIYKGFESLDIDVITAWNMGIAGNGVVVSILDDGLEYTHPDLKRNYDAKASHDFNGNDRDPFPRYAPSNINKHGTRCAGEVAAEINNGICGAGVAFNASVGGIRMLDGDVTDAVEAGSLSWDPSHIDIYSSSWGPDDDGMTVDGPGRLANKAFQDGIRKGRKGLGSIFVWATGNGGRFSDYCSCDGYINSPYTISVGAVNNCGRKPWYAEACPSTFAVTYSSGESSGNLDKQIATTDLRGGCTTTHTGTSAAAPLAAGIFALVLEANRRLTWRDLQHLVARTSVVISPDDSDWITNGAGHKVNIKFGFGALSAGKLVKAARDPGWQTALPQHECSTDVKVTKLNLKQSGSVYSSIYTDGCVTKARTCVTKLEHVHVIIDIEKPKQRGELEIILTSPSGTRSDILRPRRRDVGKGEGFRNWAFLTVFHWDENPTGKWTLEVKDHSLSYGKLNKWSLRFYGTCSTDILSVNETEICDKECKRNCPKPFSDVCIGCAQYCDCTIGRCVSDCGDHLVTDSEFRHCKRSNEDIKFNYIPNSGGTTTKPLTGISISAMFAIICLALVIVSVMIGGIAYFAAQMPSKNDTSNKGYHSVSRYPCSEVVPEEDYPLKEEDDISAQNFVVNS